MTPFNLSDKIQFGQGGNVDFITQGDIKEFIKLLKDYGNDVDRYIHYKDVLFKINQLAGDKLNGN